MYNYFSLPCPAPASVVAAYKSLRLRSLRVDAACFGSTYTQEAAFTDDKWRERLCSPFKRTFVASASSTSLFKMEGKEGFPESSSWVATVTVLAPSELLPSTVERLEQSGWRPNWEPYLLVGLWVHPEHRSKGLAKELMKRGLEWARAFTGPKFTETNDETERMVALAVHDNNEAACTLYTKMGFHNLEGGSWEEGLRCMVVKV